MVAKSLAKLLLGGLGGAASTYGDITKSRMESDSDLYNALAKLQLANDLEQNSPLYQERVRSMEANRLAAERSYADTQREKAKQIELSGQAAAGVVDRGQAQRDIASTYRKADEQRYYDLLAQEDPSWFSKLLPSGRRDAARLESERAQAKRDLVASIHRERESLLKSPEEQAVLMAGTPERYGEMSYRGIQPIVSNQPVQEPTPSSSVLMRLGDPKAAQRTLIEELTRLEQEGYDIESMQLEDMFNISPLILEAFTILSKGK